MSAQSSRRERLLSRPRPRATYRILVDPDGLQAAQEALLRAQEEARQIRAKAKPGKAGVAALRRADRIVSDARAAIDACYETFTFEALPTEPIDGKPTIEELLALHPPTPEEMAKAAEARKKATERGEEPPDWPVWSESFRAALLAACDVDGMSEEDWRSFLATNVSNGEKVRIWQTVIAVNERERVADSLVLPKELTAILNSLSN